MSIVARTSAGTNDIRFHQFPALDDGNDSFPNGQYRVDGAPSAPGDHLVLLHQLDGAPLIQRFIDQGRAAYACAIAAPRSAHREVQTSSSARQCLSWDPSNFGEPPYFTPMIVCMKETTISMLNRKKDGVHQDWHGQKVCFPKGARLAQGPVMHLMASDLQKMLSTHPDPECKPGQFYVEVSGDDVFGFSVHCHPSLHRFLKEPGERKSKRQDILTHMVTACFSLLQRDYQDDDGEEGWRTHKILELLAQKLEDAGYEDWSSREFRPEQAATLLYGHRGLEQETTDE